MATVLAQVPFCFGLNITISRLNNEKEVVLFKTQNAQIVLSLLIQHSGVDDICKAQKGEYHSHIKEIWE